MRTIKGKIAVLLIIVVLIPVITADNGKSAAVRDAVAVKYDHYTEIPGVTAEHIAAIEALKAESGFFIYGMNPSTEAFYTNGVINGYSARFCEWLGDLFGIPFVPELYEWGDLIAGLKSGDIDFTGELTANEERRKTFFMTDAIAERSIKTMRIGGLEPLDDILKKRPLRYGFLEGTTTVDQVVSLTAAAFEIFYTDDYDTAYAMLKNGEIDAFFDESPAEAAFDIYGDVVAYEFFPLIYSPVSLTTQNHALEPIIEVVQLALENGALRYLTDMYNSGQQDYMRHKLNLRLSDEEKEYIKNNPAVAFAAEYDNYPISFFNQYSDEWQGIAFDVLDEIEYLTGLKFTVVNARDAEWFELFSMLETGEAAMISELIRNTEREGRFLWPESRILTDKYILISKYETRNIKINEMLYMRVGLPGDTALATQFKTWFPNHMYTYDFENVDAAFEALTRGEVDLVMASQSQLLILTNYRELTGYKANFVFNHTYGSTFGFNIDNAVLCSIVDKALELTDTEMISGQWLRKTFDYSSKLVQARRPWLIGGMVLLCLLILMLFILFKKTKNEGRRLEALVKDRTDKLNALNNYYKGVIWSVNKDKVITTFKGKYLKVIGVTPAFLEGKHLSLARIKNPHGELIDGIEKTFEEGPQDWYSEMGGNIFHTITTPIYDLNGEVTDVVGSTDDVTELIRLHRELETAVKAAEDASMAKSSFLANMSHEIRTPINAIVGMTSIGAAAADVDKMKYSFGKIQDASNHLLGVINNILDMSKIEAGKFEITPVEFEFDKMLKQVINIMNFRVEEKRQKLRITIDNDIPERLYGDDQRISQVIMNLLSNAVKFTPENGTVGLDARYAGEEGGFVTLVFTVTDTGIGITPEQQKKLFQKFQQADDFTTRRYGGTGLGLSISKGILDLIGGRIWIESEFGKGSAFKFTLCLKKGSKFVEIDYTDETGTKAPGQPADRGEYGESGKSYDFNGRRVLLVEDMDINREIVQTLLEPSSIEIVCAENGAEAVNLFSGEPDKYDLIFMDLQMPVMDGYEATRHIRSLNAPNAKTIPIIAMTANVYREDVEKCLDAGMNGHIGKPFQLNEVLEMLDSMMGAAA